MVNKGSEKIVEEDIPIAVIFGARTRYHAGKDDLACQA